jgi:hypothetical protein
MDFTQYNFVKNCQTVYEYNASSSLLSTSTERCYNSAVALNEVLLVTLVFVSVLFIGIRLLRK